MAKTKEQNIKRELIAGGTLMTLSLPLVLFVLLGVLMGTIVGTVFLSGSTTRDIGLSMLAVYGSLMFIFGWLFWRISKRIRLLFHRRQLLKDENQRVADMINTTSAETRLREQPITTTAHHVAETHEHPSRDSQSE